jgi:hypothetical protein
VREAVIENPHVPPDLVTNLYKVMDKNRHGSVRHQLPFASHPATPPEFLDNLAKSWWVGIRSAVAANPAMPASVVQALSKDPKPEVREQIAARPDIPVPVIDVLAEDKCTPVRLRIAQRDSLSPKLVTRLAMDKDAAVRLAMTRKSSSRAGTGAETNGYSGRGQGSENAHCHCPAPCCQLGPSPVLGQMTTRRMCAGPQSSG